MPLTCIFPLKWLLKQQPIKKNNLSIFFSISPSFCLISSSYFLFLSSTQHPYLFWQLSRRNLKVNAGPSDAAMEGRRGARMQKWGWEVWEGGWARLSEGLSSRMELWLTTHNLQQMCMKWRAWSFKQLKYQAHHVPYHDPNTPIKDSLGKSSVHVSCFHISKKTCRLHMSLEFRQYVLYNWDTASILRSTKWVILGFITPALYDICVSQSGLFVQISKATFNTEMFDS